MGLSILSLISRRIEMQIETVCRFVCIGPRYGRDLGFRYSFGFRVWGNAKVAKTPTSLKYRLSIAGSDDEVNLKNPSSSVPLEPK